MMANSGWNSHEEQPRAASKSFQRHTEHREPMPDDERFLGSVRRECLDHFLVFHEKQLCRLRKRVCRVLQPGSTPSRAWPADCEAAGASSCFAEPVKPGERGARVRSVPPPRTK